MKKIHIAKKVTRWAGWGVITDVLRLYAIVNVHKKDMHEMGLTLIEGDKSQHLLLETSEMKKVI